jgi:hypothetical protein
MTSVPSEEASMRPEEHQGEGKSGDGGGRGDPEKRAVHDDLVQAFRLTVDQAPYPDRAERHHE